ncbi:MAG TPA: hypothetical protein DCX32_01995 [Candidatus Moranbacteria bacterium]|nr:MAG: Undecaprenyl-phosphate alpha-N-acetylglucosaminyltransferase [Candidatus Moranbacteria bacterium GW2011_GWC2_45_10]KKT95469.1 MAG: glycosyl transferase, family 4, conserved region, UDP-N-acetylglucosamine:undecaprenyl-P N-acetylglucosaminyl 1-P transferase [Parcubacteria group bacterium GW2011_GWC1_45_14]HAV11294.1 hypothetical protein [Candidatus Moranbacteria bacterium]
MDHSLYLLPFLSSFSIALALLLFLLFAKGFVPEKRKAARHIHGKGVSRLGGIAIILSFGASLLLDPNLFISRPLQGVLIALVFVFIVGLWDDARELDWRAQIFFQIAIVVFIFIMGVRVEYVSNPLGGVFELNPEKFFLPSLLLIVAWVIILMNSMNWVDGVDGLSGGITLIGAITIFLLSLKPEVNQPPVAIIAASLVGAVLAFLILNFHPSKILAGTSGSMFMGFILAILAVFAGTKIATALLVMAIPIADACWVIFERIRSGQSVFEADRRHLHHKLLELGWSQRKICLFFYIITALIAAVALNTRTIGKAVTILLVAVIMLAMLYYINRRTNSVTNKVI